MLCFYFFTERVKFIFGWDNQVEEKINKYKIVVISWNEGICEVVAIYIL